MWQLSTVLLYFVLSAFNCISVLIYRMIYSIGWIILFSNLFLCTVLRLVKCCFRVATGLPVVMAVWSHLLAYIPWQSRCDSVLTELGRWSEKRGNENDTKNAIYSAWFFLMLIWHKPYGLESIGCHMSITNTTFLILIYSDVDTCVLEFCCHFIICNCTWDGLSFVHSIWLMIPLKPPPLNPQGSCAFINVRFYVSFIFCSTLWLCYYIGFFPPLYYS